MPRVTTVVAWVVSYRRAGRSSAAASSASGEKPSRRRSLGLRELRPRVPPLVRSTAAHSPVWGARAGEGADNGAMLARSPLLLVALRATARENEEREAGDGNEIRVLGMGRGRVLFS